MPDPTILERIQDAAVAAVNGLKLAGLSVYPRLAEDQLRSQLPALCVFWAEGPGRYDGPGRRYERFTTEHDARLYELGAAIMDRAPIAWEQNRSKYAGWGEALEGLFLSESFIRPAVPEVLDVEVTPDVMLKEREAYQLLVSGWTLRVRCVTPRAA